VDPPVAALIAALAATADQPADAAPPHDPPPVAAEGAGRVALLVEDSPTVRLLHAALLAETGCAVELAAEGREALALAGARRYDLIVSGLETGALRGPDLAAALHERAGGAMPPFVLLRNDDASPTRQPFIAAEVRTEPHARERLTATVRSLLARAARD
jgi:CheY-like chemotaxis protein